MNAPTRFPMPELNDGEIYAGAIINPDGTGHHVILLEGDNDDADWQTQMDWAKSIGGDLPDRVEQAMFYKHLPDQFKKDWYWSNTQRSAGSAWNQFFGNGPGLVQHQRQVPRSRRPQIATLTIQHSSIRRVQ